MTELAQLRSPHLVPLLGTSDLDRTTWLLSVAVEGVSLQRLLALVTLTPAQAGQLGAQLLRGIAALHDEGLAHGRLHAGNVLVSRGGDPLLTDWALSSIAPTRPVEELRGADLEAAGALLVSLARNARRPVVRNDPGQQALLTHVEQVGVALASVDPAAAAHELDSAVLGAVPEDVGTALICAELAALVTTVTRNAEAGGSLVKEQRPQTADRPAFVPPTLPRSAVPSAAWQPPGRTRRSRWIFAAAVLVLAAAVALIVARKPVSSVTDRLLHRHPGSAATTSARPSTQPKATAKPKSAAATPRPVPVLAPASAGFVTGVVLRPLATCRPHSDCQLTVTIRLAPSVEVEQMDWAFTVINRCTGARTDVPGGSMTAQPGWTYVYDTRTVHLPAARSLAVVALTTAPVRAASRPFLVASSSRTC